VRPDTPIWRVRGALGGEVVVALLAIAKAGGAYLPLDASYPPQRLSLLIEDSGVGVAGGAGPAARTLPAQALDLAAGGALEGRGGLRPGRRAAPSKVCIRITWLT
jgi:non-ribosomal peptide synthetase component F